MSLLNLSYSDPESAAGILETMKKLDLEPTANTYAALAVSQGEQGDFDAVM